MDILKGVVVYDACTVYCTFNGKCHRGGTNDEEQVLYVCTVCTVLYICTVVYCTICTVCTVLYVLYALHYMYCMDSTVLYCTVLYCTVCTLCYDVMLCTYPVVVSPRTDT
jgi:hypothetical protein